MSASAGAPGALDIVPLINRPTPRALTHMESYYMNGLSDILESFHLDDLASSITPREVARMSVHLVSLSRAMIGAPGPFAWEGAGPFIRSPSLSLDLAALSYNEKLWTESIEYLPSLEVVVPDDDDVARSRRFSRIRALMSLQQAGAIDSRLDPTGISGSEVTRILTKTLIGSDEEVVSWWMYASYPPWVYTKAYKDVSLPRGIKPVVTIGSETVKEFIRGEPVKVDTKSFELGQKMALSASLHIANTDFRPYDIIADIIFDDAVIQEVIPKTGTTGTVQRIIPTEILDVLGNLTERRRSYTIGWTNMDGRDYTTNSLEMVIRFLSLSIALTDRDTLASKLSEWTRHVLEMERRMVRSSGINRFLARSISIARIQTMERLIRVATEKAEEVTRTSPSINWTVFPETSPWAGDVKLAALLKRGAHPCDSYPTPEVMGSIPSAGKDEAFVLGEKDGSDDILTKFTGNLPEAEHTGDPNADDKTAIDTAKDVVGIAYGIQADEIGNSHPPSAPQRVSVSGDRVGPYIAFTANTKMKDVGGGRFEHVTYVLFDADRIRGDIKDMVSGAPVGGSPVPLHFGSDIPVTLITLTWALDMFVRGMNTVRIEWWLSLFWFDYKFWFEKGTGEADKSFAFDWVSKMYASKIIDV